MTRRNIDDVQTLADFCYSTQFSDIEDYSLEDDSDWALQGLEESFLDDIETIEELDEESISDEQCD